MCSSDLADDQFESVTQQFPGLRVVIALDLPKVKRRLLEHYGASVIGLRSTDAYVSSRATTGDGCVLQRGVKVMANARLGRVCKLNINATVHHDVTVGDFCTLAPGSLLLGNVAVGEGTYVGAGAIVRQRVRIGNGAFIGAGAVVVRDVPDGATVVGVPADRRLK